MKFWNRKKQSGFTIIEVLIVLAIAGLIMSIVFVAVPQLQRNARDSKRQNIANRLSSELQTYASNNGGNFPWTGTTVNPTAAGWDAAACGGSGSGSCADWKNNYVLNASGGVNIADPKTGANYNIRGGNITAAPSTPTYVAGTPNVFIAAGAKCSGADFASGSNGGTNSKDFAIMIQLERTGTFYCVDNG